MSKRSKAALLSMIYLAALANVHATVYWLLCYTLTEPSLRAAIEEEIAQAFTNGIIDASYIVEKCLLLNSAFHGVFRLHITSNTVRYVEQPTKFGNKTLAAGNRLMIPLRQLNHSESILGTDHDQFNHEHFLKNKSLASHTAFRPFGWGYQPLSWQSLCKSASVELCGVLAVYVRYIPSHPERKLAATPSQRTRDFGFRSISAKAGNGS
ncbi:hypothetical protein CC80DRAFT_551201 [Byssothecium circinans]|uniref:Cytochrome P450 n=1 Tax=Byssothecium circinans TaxID=147558 RepID=A0A6A5TL14_9PLEO|nr:hypothetical protein CC80DRAFT_551201 [Byssothecium circinans]